MAESEKVERRKEQRRLYRTRVRQVLLIVDYIQHKYFDIYAEAAQFYNALNQQYSTKHDLRKTAEYRKWKMQVMGQSEKHTRKYLTPSHPNIQTPIRIHPQTEITVIYEDQPSSPDPSEHPETPCEDQPSSPDPSEHPETPCEDQPSSPDPSEHPETPCEDQPSSPDPSEHPETRCEDQPSSPDPSEHPETPCEDHSSNPVELRAGKHTYTDNMQLRIPLMESPKKHPAVTTTTLQTVTEEILQEDTNLEPSLYEELSPEVVEKIISELRAEPDLQSILTSIEQELEFDQLGMDIDIPEDNLLESELENW